MTGPSRLGRLDAADRISRALGTHFQPRVTQAVRHLQEFDGPDLETALPRFAVQAKALAQTIGASLPEGEERDRFLILARRLIEEELAHLSVMAAGHKARMREETHRALLEAQIGQAASWPESQPRFAQAAENGLSAIEAHRTLLGQGMERIEAEQARFLSALLAARLKALAPRDIAKAWSILGAHHSWLGPEDVRSVQAALLTQDRLARAKAIAETLCRFGTPGDWRAKTAQAAQDAQPDDADFAALVDEMVQARADIHDADIRRDRQAAGNRLLEWIADHRLRHLEDALAAPANAQDWEKLPTRQRTNLLAALRRNRTGQEPTGGWKSEARYRCAMGLYRRHPKTFARIDLTHPMWGDLPASDLTALTRRQSALAAPGHYARHRDQSAILRHLAARSPRS